MLRARGGGSMLGGGGSRDQRAQLPVLITISHRYAGPFAASLLGSRECGVAASLRGTGLGGRLGGCEQSGEQRRASAACRSLAAAIAALCLPPPPPLLVLLLPHRVALAEPLRLPALSCSCSGRPCR